MNIFLLSVVGLIYLTVGINYYMQGNTGMTIVFIAYAVANVGLLIAGEA